MLRYVPFDPNGEGGEQMDTAELDRPANAAQQLTFEGISVDACRAQCQASVIVMDKPLPMFAQGEVKIRFEVAEVRYVGNPPTRMHVLRVLEAEIVE